MIGDVPRSLTLPVLQPKEPQTAYTFWVNENSDRLKVSWSFSTVFRIG